MVGTNEIGLQLSVWSKGYQRAAHLGVSLFPRIIALSDGVDTDNCGWKSG